MLFEVKWHATAVTKQTALAAQCPWQLQDSVISLACLLSHSMSAEVYAHPHLQAHLPMHLFQKEEIAPEKEGTKRSIWHEPGDLVFAYSKLKYCACASI